ncbi:MAG: hypothetical protein AB4060_07080 [Crocosphaera sp.]
MLNPSDIGFKTEDLKERSPPFFTFMKFCVGKHNVIRHNSVMSLREDIILSDMTILCLQKMNVDCRDLTLLNP